MARPIKVITAGAEIRAELQRRANAPTCAHRDRFRAKTILLRLEGLKIEAVAKQLKTLGRKRQTELSTLQSLAAYHCARCSSVYT